MNYNTFKGPGDYHEPASDYRACPQCGDAEIPPSFQYCDSCAAHECLECALFGDEAPELVSVCPGEWFCRSCWEGHAAEEIAAYCGEEPIAWSDVEHRRYWRS